MDSDILFYYFNSLINVTKQSYLLTTLITIVVRVGFGKHCSTYSGPNRNWTTF